MVRAWIFLILTLFAALACINGNLRSGGFGNNNNNKCPPTISNIVLGQLNATTITSGLNSSKMSTPTSVICVNQMVYAVDSSNNRVMGWNSIPTSFGQSADFILGQSSFTAGGFGVSQSAMNGPYGISSDGYRLFVADTGNNRVLIWNSLPNTMNQNADIVLGQPTFGTSTLNFGGIGPASLYQPEAIASDGFHLFVADTQNSRVLIWNGIPTANFMAANTVVGQTIFTAGGTGSGNGSVLSLPQGVATDQGYLFVADTSNNRVLIWTSIPSTNGVSASYVVGQPTMATNGLGTSSVALNSPFNVSSANGQLYVADKANSRILKWNNIPSSNGVAADAVYGQPGFLTGASNNPSATTGLWTPFSVFALGGSIMISDSGNNRIFILNF